MEEESFQTSYRKSRRGVHRGGYQELDRVYLWFSCIQSVALTMHAIIFPLLLQKPSKTSKARDHVAKLKQELTEAKDDA